MKLASPFLATLLQFIQLMCDLLVTVTDCAISTVPNRLESFRLGVVDMARFVPGQPSGGMMLKIVVRSVHR